MEDERIHKILKAVLNKTSLEELGELLEFLVGVIKSSTEDKEDAQVTLADSLAGVTELDTTSLATQIISRYLSTQPKHHLQSITKPGTDELNETLQIEKPEAPWKLHDRDISMDKLPVAMSAKQKRKLKRQAAKEKRVEEKKEIERFIEKPLQFPGFRRTGGGNKNINLFNPSLSIGGKIIIDPENHEGQTVTFQENTHYGLLGQNGCGKSTFLRYLSCKEFPDDLSTISFYHVEQEIEKNDKSVLLNVLEADLELFELLEEEEMLYARGDDNCDRLLEIFDRLSELEYETAVTRAATILAGLGFTPAMQKQPTRLFSGGWLMRVAIAKALFCSPDALLLDEPTNHLDFHALIWLEEFLKTWAGTLIIVSHQVNFLRAVCSSTVFLSQEMLTIHNAPYSSRLEAFHGYWIPEVQQKLQQNLINEYKKFKAAFPASRQRVKRLIENTKKAPLYSFSEEKFSFSYRGGNSFTKETPLTIRNCSFSYPPVQTQDGETKVIENLNFSFASDCRIALVGRNGCGKTTLLKLLAGGLQPSAGEIDKPSDLRVSFFTQEFVDQLDMVQTPREYLQSLNTNLRDFEIVEHLKMFGLRAPDIDHRVELLSGGQKSRLAFAKISLEKPHLLLLDEPSNHLDMKASLSLARGLSLFHGAVIVVSHDEKLINTVCDEIVFLEDGKLQKWSGDIKSYKIHVLEQIEEENRLRKQKKRDLKKFLRKSRS